MATSTTSRTAATAWLARWPLLLLVAGVPALLLGWGLASAARGGPLPASGGRLTEGVVGPAPQRINPLFADPSGPERDLATLVFSGLTRPGVDGSPQPDLAESWVVSTDATNFTFVLRQDVQWQDGQPFTSDDVLFTARAFSAPGVKGDPSVAEVWRRARVQKLGPYGVLFQFDSPFAPFLAFTSTGILPSHLLAKDTPDQLVNDRFNAHPVGTGPYRLRSVSSTVAELRPNSAYYLGAPYLDRLTLRFLPDTQAVLDALRSRVVDSGILPPPVAGAELDTLRGSGHTLIGGLRSVYSLVYLNLNLAQFQDPAVRRALSLATNRDRLVQTIMDGQATAADVPLPPGTWAGADQAIAFSADQARSLLQSAGWMAGSDGVLRKGMISLSFLLQTTDDPQRLALANELAQQWRAIGVASQVVTQSESTLLSDVLLPHKYEAVLYGWDPGPDPDPFPAWHSSQRDEQGRNLSAYADPHADQLLEIARQTAEQADRAQLFGAFAQQFRQDLPAVVLFYPRYVYAVPSRLRGVRLGLLSSTANRFAGTFDWSLLTRDN